MVGLVLDATHRGLEHHGQPELACRAARFGVAAGDAGRIRRQPDVAQQCKRLGLVEPRPGGEPRARGGERRVGIRGAASIARVLEVAEIEQALHTAQERGHAIQDREAFAGGRDDQRVRARSLAVRHEERGLARGLVADAEIIEVAVLDHAAGDPIVDDGAQRRVGIAHQCGEALLHPDVIIRSAGAPCVERVDGRQTRVEQRLEPGGRCGRETGKRHAGVVRKIDQELPLAAGIVQASRARRRRSRAAART